MRKLFEMERVFVWYPKHNLTPSLRCELSGIYRKIGARNISESLYREESSLVNDGAKLKHVDPNDIFNLKGLVKLILGFLACSSLEMEPKKRHEAVQSLLSLSFHETKEPINVSYSLPLSNGETITKKANKRVRWESQSSMFIIQKMDRDCSDAMKHATNFSEAISEGVLRENHDYVPALSELITLGFFLKFKNEEIDFLMESKYLQIDYEDDKFLNSAFPSD
jgi:sacsin